MLSMAGLESPQSPALIMGDVPPVVPAMAPAVAPGKEEEVVFAEKEEMKEEPGTPGRLEPKVLTALRGLAGGKLGKLSKRPPSGKHGKEGKLSKRPPEGKHGKLGKLSKRPPTGKHGKLGKLSKMPPSPIKSAKYSKRPPYVLRRVKGQSDTSVKIRTGICLLSVKATIIGKREVQLPVWRPSVIPENSSIGHIMSLWAERTFGQTLRAHQLPSGARCYAGAEKRKLLDRNSVLRKIKRKLPLVDGRLSLCIAWPLTDSGMVIEDKKGSQLVKHQSWAIKRRIGEDNHALAKIGALMPIEEPRRKKPFFCYLFYNNDCTDPDCPYPHFRL